MKILAVIPARYESSRFEGKPLKDICGKPMIWWTYNAVKKSKLVTDVIVATDNEQIRDVCDANNMNVIMTSNTHKMMLERVWEVSEKIKADIYVNVAGDEPLIEAKNIDLAIKEMIDNNDAVVNLKTLIENPVDVINWTTMKVVTDDKNYALFASRSPIPYPKANVDINYYKHMGTYVFKKEALDFFVNTKRGSIENIEDFDLLRFIEHNKKVKIIEVNSKTISVDTPKDLERVGVIIKESLDKTR